MKQPRPSRLGALLLLAPALALAHPGHDGPHDFEWDFGHLADHPLATAAGVAILVALGVCIRLYWRSNRREQPKAERIKR